MVALNISGEGIGTMNTGQAKIFEWLRQVEPGLAELYEGAVRLITDRSFPGRGRLVCHAVREIRNQLPAAVAGKGKSNRLEYRSELDKLAAAYKRSGSGSVLDLSSQTGDTLRAEREVLVLLEQLIKRHEKVKDIKEHNATRLLVELEPDNKQWKQSLVPVVEKWIDETDWFVDRVHVGEQVDGKSITERFAAFEDVLLSLVGYFYEGQQEIETLVEETNRVNKEPDKGQVDNIVRRLGGAKYRTYFFDKLTNPHWIEPLRQVGFFQVPGEPREGEAFEPWLEGRYLKRVASKAPEKVLHVISKVRSANPYVRNACLECLLEMPQDVAARGVDVVANTLPRGVHEGNLGWAWCGEQAAKLMVKLAEQHQSQAFRIAWKLLDAWVPQEQEGGREIQAKFGDWEYRELVQKYFSKLWAVNAWKALEILVRILNRCLVQLDKGAGYDVSSHFHIREALRDLDSIDVGRYDIEPVLVKSICDVGILVAERETNKLDELLDVFEKYDRVIFWRIEMHLLRFVGPGLQKQRINRIVGDRRFIEDSLYRYEHRRLLNDKYEELEEKARQTFVEWIEKPKITEERKKDAEEWCRKNDRPLPDFGKWEYQAKAEELYLVREREEFKERYEEYKRRAGVDDAALAPRRFISEARAVSPMEGTPLELEEMVKMSASEVLDYVLDPNNYQGEEQPGAWGTPGGALRETFKADIKKRPYEYLACDSDRLEVLRPDFLGALFYATQEAVRDGSLSKSTLPSLISLAHKVVQNNSAKLEYRNCFSAILSALRDGFTQEDRKIEFDEQIIENLWDIASSLVRYEEEYQNTSEERDPMQMRCSSVNGEALEQVVMLGIVCKNDFSRYYEDHLKAGIRELLDYVVVEVKRPEVNCTLGIEFGRIDWLDEEWLSEHIEQIFEDKMWDVVWGTHVSWGRPSRPGFELLVEKGIYDRAIGKLGTPNRYKFGEDPEEGFVGHLMIAFFNGWIDFENELLNKFFDKAPARLRGYAAQFLTTGFESLKKEGKDYQEFTQRLRIYWQKRLDAIQENPEANLEESIEFTSWIKDSLLEPKKTLELLNKTLEFSGGKLGRFHDTRGFVASVCEFGKGNELIALQCLKKAAADEEMRMPWASYQDQLTEFLESLIGAPKDIRDEAIEVADAYGRLHPEKFREIWDKLKSLD